MKKTSKNLLILVLLVIIGIFVYQYTNDNATIKTTVPPQETQTWPQAGKNNKEKPVKDEVWNQENTGNTNENTPANEQENDNNNDENTQANQENNGDNTGTPTYTQTPNRTPCDELFPYPGNQGNSTFIDTTASVYNFNNQSPEPVYNGYEIRGCVRQIADTYDNWAPFEGVIGTWKIKDANGNILVSGILNAELSTSQPDIMSAVIAGDMVAFTESVAFDFTPYAGQSGTLELINDNPSGEAQNDRSVQIPITFQ